MSWTRVGGNPLLDEVGLTIHVVSVGGGGDHVLVDITSASIRTRR